MPVTALSPCGGSWPAMRSRLRPRGQSWQRPSLRRWRSPSPALTGSGAPPEGPATRAQRVVLPVAVPAAELARLPRATTYANIPAAPSDPAPFVVTSGLVVHPRASQIVYSGPGKPPVAVLPPTELGAPTWVPVVQISPGWERVLLPSRPNRATGWIYTAAAGGSQLDTRRSAYLVKINVGARKLSVPNGGRLLGTWTAAAGAPATPDAHGTDLLARVAGPAPPHLQPAHPAAGIPLQYAGHLRGRPRHGGRARLA